MLHHLPRFRRAARELPILASRETWTRGEIEAFQLERLNRLWRHAVATVPHYRQLREAGAPDRFAGLDEFRRTVPILHRSEVRESPRTFVSEAAGRGSWHRTGGTTGAPVPIFWSHASHQEMLRYQYRFFQMWGIELFDRAAYLWGHGASLAPGIPGLRARVRMRVQDRLRNRLRISAYEMGADDLRRDLEELARFRPRMLYGYATAVWLLAEEAARVGASLPSLRLVVLTAEPTTESRIEDVQRHLSTRAAVEYGSVETGLMAHSWPDHTFRVREDLCLVETHPRPDGRYDVVVSALANEAFPLLRYAIRDTTDAPIETPERGFAILGNVVGRDMDLLARPDGGWLHPFRIEVVFQHDAAIRRFRLHQREDGSLRALVEPSGKGQVDTARLARDVAQIVGYPAEVEVVDEIPLTPAGKHRAVTSDLGRRFVTEKTRRE